MLDIENICSQMRELKLRGSAVVDCSHEVHEFGLNFTVKGDPKFWPGPNNLLTKYISPHVRACENRNLVIFCDLGSTKNPDEAQVNGAIRKTMTCLSALMEKGYLWSMLYDEPERVIIATIENGRVVLHGGQGKIMLDLIKVELQPEKVVARPS